VPRGPGGRPAAVSTRISRIVRLPADAFSIAVKEDVLGISPTDLEGDDLKGFGEEPTLPGTDRKEKPQPVGVRPWSAEVFLPWATLGLEEPGEQMAAVRCDFGVMDADAGGMKVSRRLYWSNPAPGSLGDTAIEAMLMPGAWGTLRFKTK